MRHIASLVFAVALAGAAAGASAADPSNETPQQNVKESQQYDQLTCSNPAFRAKRIAQECGSLQGSQFYDGCVASFSCGQQPSAAHWRNTPPSETTK